MLFRSVAAALSAPPAAAGADHPDGRDGDAAIPTLEQIELAHIRRVLEICQGNRTAAAQRLGITRQTLAKKIGQTDEA